MQFAIGPPTRSHTEEQRSKDLDDNSSSSLPEFQETSVEIAEADYMFLYNQGAAAGPGGAAGEIGQVLLLLLLQRNYF